MEWDTVGCTIVTTDDFHYGGWEVAHAVYASLAVMDVALPATIHVLLQHLEITMQRERESQSTSLLIFMTSKHFNTSNETCIHVSKERNYFSNEVRLVIHDYSTFPPDSMIQHSTYPNYYSAY